MEVDPAFGHWLSGFIAGEGSFNIVRNHGCWVISFTLSQRDDDADTIHEIRDQLDLGKVYRIKPSGASKPKVAWQISRLSEQLQLIEVLDRFPIRSRKTKDYAIWKQAVLAKSAKDFVQIDELAPKLKAARTYKAADPRV